MMGRRILAVFVTALLCCQVDSFWMPDEAVISPVDAVVFVGQTLRLQCQLRESSSGTSPSDMYFEITSIDDTWTIPQQATVSGQNNISTELNITSRFTSYTTVACKGKNQRQLKSTGLIVEYQVKNITNFTGTLYYDNSTIILTWSLGESYLDPSCINVDVHWNPNSEPGSNANGCTSSSKEFCSIAWNSQDIIFVRVNVSFIRNADTSQSQVVGPPYEMSAISVHEFRPIDNLKSGPPESLKVENVNATCVWISWTNSLYFNSNPFSNITYRIEVKADDELEPRVIEDQAERQNTSEAVRVCQLNPFTKYSLSVQLRAKDINPWSDRATVTFETEEDRPLTGPPMTDTSYQVGECMDNKRDVSVYWNDPSKKSLQGRLTMFNVTSNNSPPKLLRAAYNYYTDSLDCDFPARIRVYSVTKVGFSILPSEVYIPKENHELTFEKDLMFGVEEKSVLADGRSTINVTIKWDPGVHAGNIQLIVYMCAETYIPNTCFNDFETIEVNISETEIQREIPSTTNLFGYAVKDNIGRKRGIHWTSCVYRANLIPEKPTGLHVTSGSQANSLEISWTSTRCNKNTKVLILRYYLLICTQLVEMCVDMACCLNMTVDVSRSNYTAHNLQGGRPYYVYIQAESPAGLGRRSDVKEGIPSSASSETQRILGIAMGTVAVVLAGGSVLFCFIRRCWRSKKDVQGLNKKAEAIKLPTVARQDSFDSGAYTASDPNSSNDSRPVPASRPVDTYSVQLSTHTESSAVSSIHEAAYAGEDVDAGRHTDVFPQSVEDSQSNVLNMQSEDTGLEDVTVIRASVRKQSECDGANEDVRSSPDIVESDSSNPYMRVGNTRSLPQPSEDTNAVLDNVSMNSVNDSFPLLHLSEIPHLGADMWQNRPLQEMMVFRTGQAHELTAAKGRERQTHQTSVKGEDRRQAAQQTASIGTDERQTAEQSTSKGEGNSQTTDYVRYCLDGGDNCQTEHCRLSSGSVVPGDISLSLKRQPLPNGRSQDQTADCSGTEEVEVKHNSIHSTAPQGMFISLEHQASHSRQGQNATYPSALEGSPSSIKTDWTVPQPSGQLWDFKHMPKLSSPGLSVAGSNVQENCVSSCHYIDNLSSRGSGGYVRQGDGHNIDNLGSGGYVRQGDGHKISNLSEGCGDYVSRTDDQKLDNLACESLDGYIRQYGANTKDVDQHGGRASYMFTGEESYPPENSSSVSFESGLPVNSSGCSLRQNEFSIQDFLNKFVNDGRSQVNIASGDNSQVAVNEDLDSASQDKITELSNQHGGQDTGSVREALEEHNHDHQGSSADPQASPPGSQNDDYDDEDWCYGPSDEEVSGDVEVDVREPRAASGYMPLPVNTYSGSDGSDVSYNGYV